MRIGRCSAADAESDTCKISMATIVSRRSSVKNEASMATIISRRSGSIRGVEGGVEKILASIKQKSEKYKYSPLLQRIREVSTQIMQCHHATMKKHTGCSASLAITLGSYRITLCTSLLHIIIIILLLEELSGIFTISYHDYWWS